MVTDCKETYHAHPHPRLSKVEHQRVLRPALRGLHFLQRQVDPVRLQVDLHRQGHRLQIPLMLGQQGERLVRLALRVQHRAAQHLDGRVVRRFSRQGLRGPQCRVVLACRVLREGLDGRQVGSLIVRNLRQHIGRLAQGDLGAELQQAGWQGVLGREGRGVEVDHMLVLALVEGVVDVDEFCGTDIVHVSLEKKIPKRSLLFSSSCCYAHLPQLRMNPWRQTLRRCSDACWSR